MLGIYLTNGSFSPPPKALSLIFRFFNSTLFYLTAALGICLRAYSQGTVVFSTFETNPPVNAPIYLCSFWPQTTADLTAQLFLDNNGTLTPLYPTTTFRTDSHFFSNYLIVPDQPVTVPGFPPGSTVPILLRFWETASGSFANSSLSGQVGPFDVLLGSGTNSPGYLIGFTSFGLLLCPTTSVFTRGGITYFVLNRPACPPLELFTGNDGKSFRVVPKQSNCTPESNNIIHYFVLGTLSPGTYKIFYDPLNPNTDVPFLYFTIPEHNNQKKTISNFQIKEDGRATFEVEGERNFIYIVQRSSDLKAWAEIGRAEGLYLVFTEPAPPPPGLPHYYKVQVQAPPESSH
jgi:hypothetical protein